MNDRLSELLEEIYELDHCPTQVALLEEAVREADAMSLTDVAFDLRMDLVESATYSGLEEKAMVAFSWCLAKADEDEEISDEYNWDLLWRYKWILDHLTNFPQVSIEQINHMQNDFAERLDKGGWSLRPSHYLKWSSARQMGHTEEGHAHFDRWQSSREDDMADCDACELDKHMEWLIYLREDKKAIKKAAPILKGKLTCGEIPHFTYGELLIPWLRTGDMKAAKKYAKEGYKLIAKEPDFISIIPNYVYFHMRDGDINKAVKVFERHLEWSVNTTNLSARHHNYQAGTLLLEALSNEGDKTRKLNLPSGLGCYDEGNSYKPSELAAWFRSETDALAERFNQRNGNDYYTQLWEIHGELVQNV